MSLSPGPNPDKPVNPSKPDPPPVTPNACDRTLVLDAVATLRGERLFFKDGYTQNKNKKLPNFL